MSRRPLYVSRRSAKNLWQAYRVFPDRLELQFWFALRTLVVPAGAIADLQVRRPPVWPDRAADNPAWFRTLKLDWADFFPHVSLHKKSGFFRAYRFTPDDPAAFVAACRTLGNAGKKSY